MRVGRLVRSSLKAGRMSFSVPLSSRGKASLRRRRRLLLTAKITLRDIHGSVAVKALGQANEVTAQILH